MSNNNLIVVEKHYIPRDIYLQLYPPSTTSTITTTTSTFSIPHILSNNSNIYTNTNTSLNSNINTNTNDSRNYTLPPEQLPTYISPPPFNTNIPLNTNTPLPETSVNIQSNSQPITTSNINISSSNSSPHIVITGMITRFLNNRNGNNNDRSTNTTETINNNVSPLTDLFPRLDLSNNLAELLNNLGINTNDSDNFTITTESFGTDYTENDEDDDIIISAGDLCEISCIDLWQNFEKEKLSSSITNLNEEIIIHNNHANNHINNSENDEKNDDKNDEKNDEKNKESCPICKVEFEELDICRQITSCRHIFHCVCLDMWLQHNITCPMCRHNLHGDIVLSSRESL